MRQVCTAEDRAILSPQSLAQSFLSVIDDLAGPVPASTSQSRAAERTVATRGGFIVCSSHSLLSEDRAHRVGIVERVPTHVRVRVGEVTAGVGLRGEDRTMSTIVRSTANVAPDLPSPMAIHDVDDQPRHIVGAAW